MLPSILDDAITITTDTKWCWTNENHWTNLCYSKL